jgi:hypothetical protein
MLKLKFLFSIATAVLTIAISSSFSLASDVEVGEIDVGLACNDDLGHTFIKPSNGKEKNTCEWVQTLKTVRRCARKGNNVFGGPVKETCCNSCRFMTGFVYPEGLPKPAEIFFEGIITRVGGEVIRHETPIQLWLTHNMDETAWNCIAHYHPTALDAITKTDPVPRVEKGYHTSKARALCILHALNKLLPEILPTGAGYFKSWLDGVGLDTSIMSDEEARNLAITSNDPTPRVIGSLVAANMHDYIKEDGWNYKGLLKPNGKTCSANCSPFSDSYGYMPKNDPWNMVDDTKWQPLLESNDLGFFHAQEHVTPHIGFQVKPLIFTRTEMDQLPELRLEAPVYEYNEETDKVISECSSLDDVKKSKITFFDRKLEIAAGLLLRFRGDKRWSLEAQIFYSLGYTSAEHDAVLLAWKEKINHDLVRPTSLVHMRGDTPVKSYLGDSDFTHKASDWHPYVRVMPHSEYPSGSGCLCKALADYVDAFLLDQYGQESLATQWNYLDQSFAYDNLGELVTDCGNSRLWGGMHFSHSVDDSYRLCETVGGKSYGELMKGLLGTGTFAELMDPKNVDLYEGVLFATDNSVVATKTRVKSDDEVPEDDVVIAFDNNSNDDADVDDLGYNDDVVFWGVRN